MTKTKLFSALAVAGVCAFGTQAAFAYGAGDFFARAGIAKTDLDPGYAEDENGGYLGLGYMFHDKLGVELSATEEMKHDITTDGAEGNFKQQPINLMVQYYPLGGLESRVQPYAGVGVNYTKFSDENLAQGNDIDDSWGAAGELGLDLAVTDNFGFNAFARYTDVKADVSGGDDFDLDPVTVGAGAMLRF
ncbi:OmpW/AlkL family protein [Salinicola avicenniae]|uniref:OmpW/AlkL family protein n=1 Tax=Salinicola avicenniae TaxID=2916836 RepID=UPI0020736D0D|nr:MULTISPECIES: OmpW family outer membrane protein [unclassified Salinicola]